MSWTDGAAPPWSFDVKDDKWSGHYVYVAWGPTRRGRPIYVGKSSFLRGRVAWHLARAPWAAEIVTFDFYQFSTAEEASDAEVNAIDALNPKHNIVRSIPRPRGNDADQAAIIARVQNLGRVGEWGDPR